MAELRKVGLDTADKFETFIEFDDILPYIGGCGLYQVVMCCALWVTVVVSSMAAFSQIFMIGVPDHWCRVPELQDYNLSVEQLKYLTLPWEEKDGVVVHSQCKVYDVNFTEVLATLFADGDESLINRCNTSAWPITECQHGWNFDHTWYDKTIATEWELVCGKAWMGTFSMTMFSVGGIIGTIFFGWVGDRFGRRPGFFSALVVQIVFGMATAVAPEFISFTLFRTLVGLTVPAIYQTPFVLSLELVSPEYHSAVSTIIWIFFGVGYMILPLIAWATKSWRMVAVLTTAPMALFLLYFWLLPESPRWLLTNHGKEKADRIVKKIAKMNKTEVSESLLSQLRIPYHRLKPRGGENVIHLLKYPYLLKKFIVVMIVWVSNAIVYIGLSYSSGTFVADNVYLGFFFSGAVEIVSYIIIWPLMQRFGRRWPTFVTMVVAGVSCFLMLPISNDPIGISLVMLAKLLITASFAVVWIHSSEIFPTHLRVTYTSLCMMVSRTFQLGIPQIVYLATYSEAIPLITFGVVAIAGGCLVLYLPETLNENLPETLDEAEEFGKEQKFWSFKLKPAPDKDVKHRVGMDGHVEVYKDTTHQPYKETETQGVDAPAHEMHPLATD